MAGLGQAVGLLFPELVQRHDLGAVGARRWILGRRRFFDRLDDLGFIELKQELVGGGPQPERATLISGSADASAGKPELKMSSLLPEVSTNLMAGLIETLAAEPYNGHAGLPTVAERRLLEVDDLFPVAEMLEHLGFAELKGADITLTDAGKLFADYGTQERKTLFAEHLIQHVPLAARIHQVLLERSGHRAPRVRFEQELEDSMTEAFVEKTLESVVAWGRYAEIFSYDDHTETFSLEDVEGSM